MKKAKLIIIILITMLISVFSTMFIVNTIQNQKYSKPKFISSEQMSKFSDEELRKIGMHRREGVNGIAEFGYNSDAFTNKEKKDYRDEKLNDPVYKIAGSYTQDFIEENIPKELSQERRYDFKKDWKEIKILDGGKTVEYIVENGSKVIFKLENPNGVKLVDYIQNAEWFNMSHLVQ